ncbi:MAG TPA: tol-pal system protein YbgF [Thermoanaerobaculia bacterium]|jgi:tol-pal system protein YbgF|nr:tol-pal system protein YbgF [Thermoanaerobaculia bacterium]
MRRFTFLLVPVCLLAGLLAAGCSGNSLHGDDDAREQEIQALKTRILQLQQEAAMNQVEVAQLRQKVAELDARNGGTRPPASRLAPAQPPVVRPVAPPPSPVSVAPAAPAPARREPIPAVAEPSNQPIEVVDIDLPATGPQPPRPAPKPGSTQAPKTAAPAPMSAAPSLAPPVAVKPAPTLPPAAAVPLPSSAPVQGESAAGDAAVPASQALYDRGYTLFHQGHFVDAETSFQRFLQANPKGDLADNAQYWIGECRYSRNDVKGALAAFRQVVEKYPKGNKVADAMLKTGQCLEAMGDVEGARVTYREVLRRFSGSAAAAAAEERRAKLP